jgi:hypothetical protein
MFSGHYDSSLLVVALAHCAQFKISEIQNSAHKRANNLQDRVLAVLR